MASAQDRLFLANQVFSMRQYRSHRASFLLASIIIGGVVLGIGIKWGDPLLGLS
jgi:hypothetical protein